jgi:hypothetical protein
MRIKNFDNTEIAVMDWAAADRQAALRSMHRGKLRPTPAVSSGWGTDVAGRDKRSVHASLHDKDSRCGKSRSYAVNETNTHIK